MCIKRNVNKSEGNLWTFKEKDRKIERKQFGLHFYMNASKKTDCTLTLKQEMKPCALTKYTHKPPELLKYIFHNGRLIWNGRESKKRCSDVKFIHA
jgi:hypothetical protein